MSGISDLVLMPVNDDATYVKHVYLICVLWTAFVIFAAITLAVLTL